MSRGCLIAIVVSVLGVVALGFMMSSANNENERRHAAQTIQMRDAWGPEVMGICNQRLPEQPSAWAEDSRIAFLGRVQGKTAVHHPSNVPVKIRATSQKDITHVACVAHAKKKVESCSYNGGHTVPRSRTDTTVRLVDLRTRTVAARWTAQGGEPNCPASITVRRGTPTYTPDLVGPEPNYARGLLELPGLGTEAPAPKASPARSKASPARR